MTKIGLFERTATGFQGRLRTLTLDVALHIVPAEASDAENAPHWRIHLGDHASGPEVGAAWNRTGARAGDYLSLQIDDPSFGRPIRARLFRSAEDGAIHHLLWSRPDRREPRA